MVKNNETGFFRKILIFGESQKTGPIFFLFFGFYQNFNPLLSFLL